MERKFNMVGWFEIPVSDMDRAVRFYEDVFHTKVTKSNMGNLEMAFFPWIENSSGASGALVKHEEHYIPSDHAGVLIYFSSEDLMNEIERIEKAGGKVIQTKTLITEDIGYMAIIRDSEGNRIALHSRR